MGVIVPSRDDDMVEAAAHAFVSPISGYFGGGSISRSDLVVELSDGSVLLPGMTAFSLRGFGTEEFESTGPALNAHIQEVSGKLVGSAQNESTTAFSDAVVIAGD